MKKVNPKIKKYRSEIDAINLQLTQLFMQRQGIARKVLTQKKRMGLGSRDKKREKEMLESVCQMMAPSQKKRAAAFMRKFTKICYNDLLADK